MVGSVTIPFREEMLGRSLEEQVSDCRQWIALQNHRDNLLAYYYGMHDGMAQLEQIPSLAMRHQLLTEAHQALRQHSTVSPSYGGRAAMGAAERYGREIQTEATSLHAILVEVSAAGGSFCISFMQLFTGGQLSQCFPQRTKADRIRLRRARTPSYQSGFCGRL